MIQLKRKIPLKALLLPSTIFCFALAGCNPTDVSPPPNYDTGNAYIFGSQRIGSDTTFEATYWKNGVAVTLSKSKPSRYNLVAGLVVSDGDVHAIGVDGHFLMYWKNGVATNLGDSLGVLGELCISNGDVYFLGGSDSNSGETVVFKNGVPSFIKLQGLASTNPFDCTAMVILGNDVYLGGSIETSSGISPMVWKNGVPVISTTAQGWISDLAVSGGDVYACATLLVNGSSVGQAAYWKNGQLVTLADGTRRTGATSIFIFGGDVYISGWAETGNAVVATYWKNGVETQLPFSGGSCEAAQVFVADSSVYVSAFKLGRSDGILWKDGKIVPPFTGTNDRIFASGLWVE